MCSCLTNAAGQKEPADSGMHRWTASPLWSKWQTHSVDFSTRQEVFAPAVPHPYEQVQPAHVSSLGIPKEAEWSQLWPRSHTAEQCDCAQLKHPAICEGAQPNMFRPGCTVPWRLCPNRSPRLHGPLSSYASTGKHTHASFCAGPARDECLLTVQHDSVKLPSPSCQQLMLFILKDNWHQEILVWKEPHQVIYFSPNAFRQGEMLTPTMTTVCLLNLSLKPPVQEVHNYFTMPQRYSSLSNKILSHLPPPSMYKLYACRLPDSWLALKWSPWWSREIWLAF